MKVVFLTLAKLEASLQKSEAFRGRSLRFQLTLIVLLTTAISLLFFSITSLYTK